MRERGCRRPCSIPATVMEPRKSCSVPIRCARCPTSSPTSRIPVDVRVDAIPIPAVLAIATAASLCGMRGYKAIAQWAADLGQNARARFRCRHRQRRYQVPSEAIIRDVLIRVDPQQLDRALKRWNAAHGDADEALAIDGKTLCNALDEHGRQTHVMSVVGHDTHTAYTIG